ncbi:aspartate kinase [Xanthovirga aplysinae]|uniref:aspartate kinase n=1 Tax=Xanthovirga aplysinae TaxID=2529853 RepID=UPI0012BBF9A4|nr:aspartate kinase [Xanthovirga aplysinae]MTI30391.1 aspartate kinase [Xanthovirga aplysinae]
MEIYKFGGASIESAVRIKNLVDIIKDQSNGPLIIVVSALGKTTNALEEILEERLKIKNYHPKIQNLYSQHHQICQELFSDPKHSIFETLEQWFFKLKNCLLEEVPTHFQSRLYDQIVSFGEILSTKIVAAYLNTQNISCQWVDARQFIKTDSNYKEAKVDWEATELRIKGKFTDLLQQGVVLTQGFIAGNDLGETTTLGREGSDFSAAILACCTAANSVTIWKDVPGIMTADPKRIKNATKFDDLSYTEAAEMSYYGASVIHPKTIKPLANKKIPLWVKSFEKPKEKGTKIHDYQVAHSQSIIFKENQTLISFQVKDFSFIEEKNLSLIFHVLDQLNIKINMMQNSAVSFSICVDNDEEKVNKLRDLLKTDFNILYNKDLQLITVKNYKEEGLEDFTSGKQLLLEQKTRHNYQIVVSDLRKV